jgi:hypothetical protein
MDNIPSPKLKMKHATKRSLSREYVSRLANFCERFENLDFSRPILSLYETQETSIGGPFHTKHVMVRSMKIVSRTVLKSTIHVVQIVGRGLCTINFKNQTLLALDTDYLSLCHINPQGNTQCK